MWEPSSQYYHDTMETLEAARQAGMATFLWGDPGTGKTTLLRGLAKRHDLAFQSVSAPQLGIDGATGLPYTLDNGLGTDTDTPAWAKQVIDVYAKEELNSVVLFSEFSNTHRSVQAPYLNILLEGLFANGVELPPGTWIVADGNGMDSAVDSEGLAAPTANRFLHIEWDPPVEDWLEGMSCNWGEPCSDREATERMKVHAFIRTFGKPLLHNIPKDSGEYKGFPTRRSWDIACKILAHVNSSTARLTALTGLVGAEAANTFMTFENEMNLPDPVAVLADPESIDWDEMGSDAAHIVLRSIILGVGSGKPNEVERVFRVIEGTSRKDAGAANVKLFIQECLNDSSITVGRRMEIIKNLFMDSSYGDIVREAGLA